MTYPKIPLAQTIVQLCKLHNIDQIVISPGSRNAPLTIGFTKDPYFSTYSIVDERCAGFFALGISQQTNKPTVLICTSGSALLNYYPAVAEAYYSEIPLLVISADRPKHLVDIGDGQTIKQKDVYGEHVLFSSHLKSDIDPEEGKESSEELPIFKNIENKLERFLGIQKGIQEFNGEQISEAISISKSRRGPVHLNAPFNEPLYETTDKLSAQPLLNIDEVTDRIINDENIDHLANKWNDAKKKLVLVGVLNPDSLDDQLIEKLISDPSVICFTETTSNLHHPRIFNSIDKLIYSLNAGEFENLKPDIVLTLGGMVVSKRIKRFLRDYQPQEHWHLGKNRANNTFFRLNSHIDIDASKFLKEFLPKISSPSTNYFNEWNTLMGIKRSKHGKFLETTTFSDLKVFEIILESIPDETILQLSNSSVIRYTQLFDVNPKLNVYCNRGTSGIDGSTSTAIGCSVVSKKPVLLLTGDLSFLYDSNALWNQYAPSSLRIIVINNGGGGIFRIISDEDKIEHFSEYFETHHQLTAEHLSKMYGFEYNSVSELDSLINILPQYYEFSQNPKILEIFTPRKLNDEVLKAYFKYLA